MFNSIETYLAWLHHVWSVVYRVYSINWTYFSLRMSECPHFYGKFILANYSSVARAFPGGNEEENEKIVRKNKSN